MRIMNNLSEKEIEDIIYAAPWLISNRYIIPDIIGSSKEKGRQVRVGKKIIDLIFKDTKDDRPVIIELKRSIIKRIDIAQILEYRALIVTMQEEDKLVWEREFGQNYYSPKLILVGSKAPEEVKISANLAGVEIKEFGGESYEINFSDISNVPQKLEKWDNFIKSGNMNLENRDEWIEKIYSWCSEIIDGNNDIEITKLLKTSFKNGWIEGFNFPFINIGFKFEDDFLVGIYEYFDSATKYDNQFFYLEFNLNLIEDYTEDEENDINNYVKRILLENKYELKIEEEFYYTIKLSRNLLNEELNFKNEISKIIELAIELKKYILQNFSDNN